ncbi:MAG: APC family permease [Leptospirales bacterium]|nr:APC family permease [Leptospirales bacterium]
MNDTSVSLPHRKTLGQWKATAICGNDITSSCLYVSALAIVYAGQYAWIALLVVAGVLFLFRKIYGEVVGALPLNGGAYNVLLNTTSKSKASTAAILTVLSYMATAVISASEAMHYLNAIFGSLPVNIATILLLLAFLGICLLGISESASLALAIFALHMITIALLIGYATFYFISMDEPVLSLNFARPVEGSPLRALFFGFCAAMLGISGFESSSNFVEEQAPGVFPKTLRNMWIAVSVINPALTFLAIAVLPITGILEHKEALLSHMAELTGGRWLGLLVSIDAFLVLSGAVLTSFVGVTGLVKRMALDRVFPQFMLRENSRGSAYVILLAFAGLSISVLLITEGQLEQLAGVYALSFLAVMCYFAYGNLLFKIKRARLPRPEYASPSNVILALALTLLALYGNVRLHPEYLLVFLQYFVPGMIFMYLMLNRVRVARLALTVMKSLLNLVRGVMLRGQRAISQILSLMHRQKFVFFSRADDISILNAVMIYVSENEITRHLKIVTFLEEGESISPEHMRDIEVLDRAYPEIDIEVVTRTGHFGPEAVDRLSREWRIPKNFMFIGSPGDRFPYRIAELGGVRLIL